jgi:hypothetical protein
VSEYLRFFDRGRAYRATHPEASRATSYVGGSRMLKNAKIRAEIDAELRSRRQRFNVSAAKVIKAGFELLFSDLADCFDENNEPRHVRDIPLATRRWLQGYDEDDVELIRGVGKKKVVTRRTRRRYRMTSKHDAFVLLSKHLGLDREVPALEVVLGLLPRPAAQLLRKAMANQLEDDSKPVPPPAPPVTEPDEYPTTGE